MFPFVDDMPKLVQGDSARVVQIFANLISNSIKFTTCKYTFISKFKSSKILQEKMKGDKESSLAFMRTGSSRKQITEKAHN